MLSSDSGQTTPSWSLGGIFEGEFTIGGNSLSRIAEAELNVRSEWAWLRQQKAYLALSTVIMPVSRNRNYRPLMSEFKTAHGGHRGRNNRQNGGVTRINVVFF